jgi:F0F1-type ATP synthase membrane subunit c/vacuolar-type H+-ATPase subunit K
MAEPAPASEFPLEKIHAAHRKARLITMGIAATLPVYALVVELLLRSQHDVVPTAGMSTLRITFYALAGVFIFTATVVKGVLLRSAPATPEARLTRLLGASVITASFAEGPAVLGLALFMISRQRSDFYVLLVVAAYLLVRHLPMQAAWELYVRRGGDAR